MATVILVRHGRTTANADGVLAGRRRGVGLDARGREQAALVADRLAGVPLSRLVSSPLTRCRQTATAIASGQPTGGAPEVWVDSSLTECDYGAWTGRPLKELAKETLWRTVQRQPSAVIFPEGESMLAMQSRAVAAVRALDRDVTAGHGAEAVWAAVSHGDVIKSLLADALGLHLDLFQRLHVEPGSVSVIRYADSQPQMLTSNSRAGDLDWVRAASATSETGSGEAAVGGGDVAESP